MSSTKSNTVLKLKSSDKEIFEVEEIVAVQSPTIKSLVENGCAENVIPLHNVDSKTLAKVIEWCKKHADQNVEDEELNRKWDADFVDVDPGTLCDLIMASNYLNIKDLFYQTCQKFADMIEGKLPEEIRKIFNVKNDFTPEEEEELRKEYSWAFE